MSERQHRVRFHGGPLDGETRVLSEKDLEHAELVFPVLREAGLSYEEDSTREEILGFRRLRKARYKLRQHGLVRQTELGQHFRLQPLPLRGTLDLEFEEES